ncbi:MAG: DNA polymerase III beta subunit (EC [uncultured Sulfurovum sp.]|uniref:Beta sliding clamp n=1 Tax=uncultured Sulfurovum sp. TaxID=269237 RepID=A0A6S6UD88_9BACT|nr:MAG: DNA polymerase III beta subunit (EC [uncultured Sulfurovum sp.]
MRIRVSKPLIESILINLQPFLEKKDASQITSHIFVKAQNNTVTIKATDGEIGLVINSDNLIIEHEGTFTANGKKFLDIIRILKNEEIILETLESNLNIKQNKSKFKLPTFNPDNYPSFPAVEDKPQITLDSINLIKSLKKISSAIDNNNPKFELNGALLDIKNSETKLVGTDTRRLSISTLQTQNEKEFSLIIPKKAILEIQKLFMDQINIYYDDTNLIIQNENHYFFSRLINGNYPDYGRIVPNLETTKINITLPKKEMLESIKMITTISQEIKITFNEESIIFNSLTADNIEAKTELQIHTGLNEPFELNVNSRYLLDFIAQIEESEFQILLNEPTLPFVLKNKEFITVIMPIIA